MKKYTITSLAEEYAERLEDSSDPQAEVRAIQIEVDGITHVADGKPLTRDERELLAEEIASQIRRKSVSLKKATDNRAYLELVAQLKLLLGGK